MIATQHQKGKAMHRGSRKYLIIIELAEDGKYGAYVPDLPGCAVVGYATVAQARRSIIVAIRMHLEGMIEDGQPIPKPSTRGEYVAA
jgi:predicted RNase H-like HicB family nuclease